MFINTIHLKKCIIGLWFMILTRSIYVVHLLYPIVRLQTIHGFSCLIDGPLLITCCRRYYYWEWVTFNGYQLDRRQWLVCSKSTMGCDRLVTIIEISLYEVIAIESLFVADVMTTAMPLCTMAATIIDACDDWSNSTMAFTDYSRHQLDIKG